jgi:hypothetical protein
MNKILKTILNFYIKIYFFFIDKIALYKRRWKLRKAKKTLKEILKAEIKVEQNPKYLGGTKTIIKIPLDEDEEDEE